MGIKQERNDNLSVSPNLKCAECNLNMGEATEKHGPWRLREGQAVHHCDGSTVAFGARSIGPHHTLTPWPNCWRCNKSLGCAKCVSCTITELLCESCLAWGTREALMQHGPITNDSNQLRKRLGKRAPEVKDYPHRWMAPYAHSEGLFYESLELPHADTDHARRMTDVFSAAIPERYASIILQRWQGDANDQQNDL